MAELTSDSCCSPEQQTTCCEPGAKLTGGAQRAAALGRLSSTSLRSSTVW